MRPDHIAAFVFVSTVTLVSASLAPNYVKAQGLSACSSADQQSITSYTKATIAALTASDLPRYRKISRELPGMLSPACQKILNQIEPMRVKCSEAEKESVLQHYKAVFEAVSYMDPMSALARMEDLEDSVSSSCWLAINRHIDPRVTNVCSSKELDHLASFAGPIMRQTQQLLKTLDPAPFLQLVQAVTAPLTKPCLEGLGQLQAIKATQSKAMQNLPSNVLDHGGGTYSVPGLGACTPSGCMAY
jgi:hypothetical protein